MRRKQLAAVIALLMTGSANVLAQPAKAKYDKWLQLPAQASTVAGEIDDLFYLILWITSIVFALVFITMIMFMIKYRARDGGRAIYSHGNNKLEIAWTVTPALILVFLGVISQTVWSDIKAEAPEEGNALVVEVMPRQFQWDIRYPGADGKLDTPDDITTINQLHVPVNKDVLLNLEAQDVIHSFFVPEFRMKQDAVPGMLTRYWFNATKTGEYEIACAELCGLGHYRMRGFVTVHEQAGFDKWYADEMAKKAAELAPPPPPAVDTAAASAAVPDTATGTSAPSGAADTTAAGGGDTAAAR